MEKKQSGLFYCIIFINLVISLTLIILNFVWLFPVMNNSKKEEPLVENENILVPNYINLDLDSLRSSKGDCEKNLYDIYEDGVYETFNFKMKEIHKYSTGLVSILFIQIGLDIIYIVGLFISFLIDSEACGGIIVLFYLILPKIASLINLIFFILFSVYFYKGKIDDFKFFSECSFFDERNFNKTYDYIFIVYNNCKKAFIVNLIYLSINNCSFIINCMKCLFCDNNN
jgi:hypothetical protein